MNVLWSMIAVPFVPTLIAPPSEPALLFSKTVRISRRLVPVFKLIAPPLLVPKFSPKSQLMTVIFP